MSAQKLFVLFLLLLVSIALVAGGALAARPAQDGSSCHGSDILCQKLAEFRAALDSGQSFEGALTLAGPGTITSDDGGFTLTITFVGTVEPEDKSGTVVITPEVILEVP